MKITAKSNNSDTPKTKPITVRLNTEVIIEAEDVKVYADMKEVKTKGNVYRIWGYDEYDAKIENFADLRSFRDLDLSEDSYCEEFYWD